MKYILLLAFTILCFTSQAQWTKPNNSYGDIKNRQIVDSTFGFPTFDGFPASLKAVDLKRAALQFDSTNGKLRVYNPKSTGWITLADSAFATYLAGYGLALTTGTFKVDTSVIQKKLSAGTGISISGNTIYNTGILGNGTSGQVAYFNGSNSLTSSSGLTYNIGVGGTEIKLEAATDNYASILYYENGALKWNAYNNYTNDNYTLGNNGGAQFTLTQSGNGTFTGSAAATKFTASGGTASAGSMRFSSNTLILNAGSSGFKLQSDDGTSDWVTATATTFTIGDATYTNPFVHWDGYTLSSRHEFAVTTNPASGAAVRAYLGSTSTTNGQAYVSNLSTGASTTINPTNIMLVAATGAIQATIRSGTGTPEGVVTAGVGSIFLRTDGGAGTVLYIKENGTGNTGWISK